MKKYRVYNIYGDILFSKMELVVAKAQALKYIIENNELLYIYNFKTNEYYLPYKYHKKLIGIGAIGPIGMLASAGHIHVTRKNGLFLADKDTIIKIVKANKFKVKLNKFKNKEIEIEGLMFEEERKKNEQI